MERSAKRSPRVDDEMDRETRALLQSANDESRAEADRVKEGELEGEVHTAGPVWSEGPTGPGQPTEAEIERRGTLARYLKPSVFPAGRDRLLAAAEEEFAPDAVVELLRGLPDGEAYPTVEAVWEHVGGHGEHRT